MNEPNPQNIISHLQFRLDWWRGLSRGERHSIGIDKVSQLSMIAAYADVISDLSEVRPDYGAEVKKRLQYEADAVREYILKGEPNL